MPDVKAPMAAKNPRGGRHGAQVAGTTSAAAPAGYRAHDPTWLFTPLSGAGATATGGRFNRKGQPALYLSLDFMMSFGERTQGFTNKLQPPTMCG